MWSLPVSKNSRYAWGFGPIIAALFASMLMVAPAATAITTSPLDSYISPQHTGTELSGLIAPTRGHSILQEARSLAKDALKPKPTVSGHLSDLWGRIMLAYKVMTGQFDLTSAKAKVAKATIADKSEQARHAQNQKQCDEKTAKKTMEETPRHAWRRSFFAF